MGREGESFIIDVCSHTKAVQIASLSVAPAIM